MPRNQGDLEGQELRPERGHRGEQPVRLMNKLAKDLADSGDSMPLDRKLMLIEQLQGMQSALIEILTGQDEPRMAVPREYGTLLGDAGSTARSVASACVATLFRQIGRAFTRSRWDRRHPGEVPSNQKLGHLCVMRVLHRD